MYLDIEARVGSGETDADFCAMTLVSGGLGNGIGCDLSLTVDGSPGGTLR